MKLIKIEKWGTFNIGELFDIHPTKAYKLTNSSLMEEDGVNPIAVSYTHLTLPTNSRV